MLEIGTSGLMSGEGKPPAAIRSRSSALPRLYPIPFSNTAHGQSCRRGAHEPCKIESKVRLMAVPPAPPPLEQLGPRPFSFYPAIGNIAHNEWLYQRATWSEVQVRNTKTLEEIWVPRRLVGEIS